MKTILTILFLILSAVVFSMDKNTKKYLLDYSRAGSVNLSYGIEKPKEMKFTDFTNLTYFSKPHIISENAEIFVPFSYDAANAWYLTDFAAEPFDGRIEVLTVGEPLPSINITLLIACTLSILALQYRKYFEIRKNTY